MVERLYLSVDLTVGIETALSIGAGGASITLADKVAARDGRDRLIIPGSHVKGKLRHACEEIARSLSRAVCESPRAEAMCPQWPDPDIPRRQYPDGQERPLCPVCALFGNPAYPSLLYFADLVYQDPVGGEPGGQTRLDRESWLRPGIAVDRYRRTVSEEKLFLMETSPPAVPIVEAANRPLAVFRNEQAIAGTVESAAQARLLLAGLSFIRAWGGGKSRGLGWGHVRALVTVGTETFALDTLADEPQLPQGLEVLKEL